MTKWKEKKIILIQSLSLFLLQVLSSYFIVHFKFTLYDYESVYEIKKLENYKDIKVVNNYRLDTIILFTIFFWMKILIRSN